jgi:predicted DCC family thiol-disulfide oxidoreductase YuxK
MICLSGLEKYGVIALLPIGGSFALYFVIGWIPTVFRDRGREAIAENRRPWCERTTKEGWGVKKSTKGILGIITRSRFGLCQKNSNPMRGYFEASCAHRGVQVDLALWRALPHLTRWTAFLRRHFPEA